MKLNIHKLFLCLTISITLINISESRKKKHRKIEKINGSLVLDINETEYTKYNQTDVPHLLFFYAPWCQYCKEFSPEFDEASVIAKEKNITVNFYKINAMKNKQLSKEYAVTSYPKVFWVDHKEKENFEYEATMTSHGIIGFFNMMLNYTTENLPDFKSLEDKKRSGKYLIFIGDIQKYEHNYRTVLKVTKEEDIDYILWTQSSEFFKKMNISENSFDVAIFRIKNKTLDKGERFFLNASEVLDRITLEKKIELFTRKKWGKIDEEILLSSLEPTTPTPVVITIYGNKNDTYVKDLSRTLEKLAGKYVRDYWFLNATFDSRIGSIIANVFNVTYEKLPFMALYVNDPDNYDDVAKYLLDKKDLNEEVIEKFLKGYKNKQLTKFIYSQSDDIIKTENNINTINGKNYNKLVLNNLGKDVLVYLCTFSSKRCKSFRERVVRVAKKLVNSKSLYIVEIDSSFNEFTHINYNELPALALVQGFNNYKERIQNIKLYNGKLFTQDIINWIRENVKHPLAEMEILESEEEVFVKEQSKRIKTVEKEKEEDIDNSEKGLTTGLRRFVYTEIDQDHGNEAMDEPPYPDMKKMNKEQRKQRPRKDDL